jgi:hypothetical protein
MTSTSTTRIPLSSTLQTDVERYCDWKHAGNFVTGHALFNGFASPSPNADHQISRRTTRCIASLLAVAGGERLSDLTTLNRNNTVLSAIDALQVTNGRRYQLGSEIR